MPVEDSGSDQRNRGSVPLEGSLERELRRSERVLKKGCQPYWSSWNRLHQKPSSQAHMHFGRNK